MQFKFKRNFTNKIKEFKCFITNGFHLILEVVKYSRSWIDKSIRVLFIEYDGYFERKTLPNIF